MDQKSVIRSNWRKLSDYAEEISDTLSSIQGNFKKTLIADVRDFTDDVRSSASVMFNTDRVSQG